MPAITRSDGVLAQTIEAAIREWDNQKAAGASQDERLDNLERTLRAAWPQERAWQYLCDNCHDYGLQMFTCPGSAMCGRRFPHMVHEYGEPCLCKAGERFRARERTPESAVAAAAKVKRPMTRWGK